MKRLLLALALILLPLSASAAVTFPVNGGTGSSTLGGILAGNGTSAIKSVVVGSGLTFNGTTLSANGGSSASSTLLSDTNTFSGTDTFNNTITGSVSGNAGTVTNGVYTTTFNTLFDNRLSATTSLPNIITLASLSLPYSQLTGTPKIASSTLLGDTNTFSGTDKFTNVITDAALSGLIAGNSGLTYAVSTSSLNASITGNAATATALAVARTLSITGDLAYTSPSFDGSGNVTAAGTLATVNSNVGSFTNANITVNGKGLVTAASNGTAGGSAYPFTPSTFGINVSATTTPILDYQGLISATSTIGTLVASSSITNQAVKSALVLDGATGLEGAYGGAAACTNQVVTAISAVGATTCSTVADAMLASTFVKTLTVTTAQGVSGSFSAGATPVLSLTLGALTGVTSLNGLIVTANTGVITTGTWNGTTIAVANGGTGSTGPGANLNLYSNSAGNGFVGVSTSSPSYQIGTYASTTQLSSGTNNFYVNGSGAITGKDVASGYSGILSPLQYGSFQSGTTTTWTASTTGSGYSPSLTMPFAGTVENARCTTFVGATAGSFLGVNVMVNGSSATPSYFVASSTPGVETFTGGNTFTAGQNILLNYGTTTTATATSIQCSLALIQTI